MKFNKILIIILIVFFKTGNVFSNNDIFNVNNIVIEKKANLTNNQLTRSAIKKGFNTLLKKILLEDDISSLDELKFSNIKELVLYYQMSTNTDQNKNIDIIEYNITFDKEKLYDLFYSNDISYSEINDKELFILPVLSKNNQLLIYNKNFFYDNWNNVRENELIEFILPLENIETIQRLNFNKENLFNIELEKIFEEYVTKNLALVFIEDINPKQLKIYLKIKILEKVIVKKIILDKKNKQEKKLYAEAIIKIKKEIIDLIKSQNLINVSTPSFLSIELNIKKNNLAELNSILKKVKLVENIYVQEFNNEKVFLKIKYLGRLDEIVRQLKINKVSLQRMEEIWIINIIK